MPFNKGGKETRIDSLTRGLAALGYDVHIYTMQWWQGGKTKVIGPITYHAISPLYPLYAGERRSIREGVLFGIATFKLMFARFDILEVDHMPFFPLFSAKIVAVLRRKPMYATWHEVWGGAYWRQYMGRYSGTIAALIESASVRLPDHIIAVSRFTYDQLRTTLHYKGSLSLVSNGIDYAKIAQVQTAQEPIDVLYAGRLLAHKNVDVLVRAIALVKRHIPTISCSIIGDGPEAARLRSLVKELGLENNVRLLGFLDANEAIYAHMKAASVFALPSSREGFGISILEAAACGASVITVDLPDNAAKELARELHGTVVACSPEAIADGIMAQLAEHAPTATELATDYDWHALAARLSKVYGA